MEVSVWIVAVISGSFALAGTVVGGIVALCTSRYETNKQLERHRSQLDYERDTFIREQRVKAREGWLPAQRSDYAEWSGAFLRCDYSTERLANFIENNEWPLAGQNRTQLENLLAAFMESTAKVDKIEKSMARNLSLVPDIELGRTISELLQHWSLVTIKRDEVGTKLANSIKTGTKPSFERPESTPVGHTLVRLSRRIEELVTGEPLT